MKTFTYLLKIKVCILMSGELTAEGELQSTGCSIVVYPLVVSGDQKCGLADQCIALYYPRPCPLFEVAKSLKTATANII